MLQTKKLTVTVMMFLTCALFGCKNLPHSKHGNNCDLLGDKAYIYSIAPGIIANDKNDHIWNLAGIDTSYFYSTVDYFMDTKNKSRLVLVGADAGVSAGNANNLLMLFTCADTPIVVWAGQTSDISQGLSLTDLNGDGIKELIEDTHAMWMGECNSTYSIFNFKGGKQNFLYSAHSISVIDCGGDSLARSFKKGDTLEHVYHSSLRPMAHSVRQIETVKIHNGGNTDEEIIKKLKVYSQTTEIQLGSIR